MSVHSEVAYSVTVILMIGCHIRQTSTLKVFTNLTTAVTCWLLNLAWMVSYTLY